MDQSLAPTVPSSSNGQAQGGYQGSFPRQQLQALGYGVGMEAQSQHGDNATQEAMERQRWKEIQEKRERDEKAAEDAQRQDQRAAQDARIREDQKTADDMQRARLQLQRDRDAAKVMEDQVRAERERENLRRIEDGRRQERVTQRIIEEEESKRRARQQQQPPPLEAFIGTPPGMTLGRTAGGRREPGEEDWRHDAGSRVVSRRVQQSVADGPRMRVASPMREEQRQQAPGNWVQQGGPGQAWPGAEEQERGRTMEGPPRQEGNRSRMPEGRGPEGPARESRPLLHIHGPEVAGGGGYQQPDNQRRSGGFEQTPNQRPHWAPDESAGSRWRAASPVAGNQGMPPGQDPMMWAVLQQQQQQQAMLMQIILKGQHSGQKEG